MNALLTPHRRVVWVAWLIVALLCLIGNDLVYGITVPLTASLLVLLARWVGTRAAGRRVDGRDILAVSGCASIRRRFGGGVWTTWALPISM